MTLLRITILANKRLRFGLLFRIAGGFAVVTCLLITITVVSSVSTNKVGEQFKLLSTQTNPLARDSQILANELLFFETKVRAIASSLNTNQLNTFNSEADNMSVLIEKQIASLNTLSNNNSEQLALLKTISAEFVQLKSIHKKMLDSKNTYFFSESEIEKISKKLDNFEKEFTPLLEDLFFDLDSIDDKTTAILYETQTLVVSGMWYIEQIKASRVLKDIEDISGSEFFIWLGDITSLSLALKKANDSPEVAIVSSKIIQLASELLNDVRGTTTPAEKAAGVISGLGAFRFQLVRIEKELNENINTFGTNVASINESINKLVNLSSQQAKMIETQVEEEISSSLTIVFILSAVAVLISIIISFLITLSFKTGLHNIKNILAKFSEGDLSIKFGKHPNNEMGDLERYSQKMADSLRDLISDINKAFDQVNVSVNEAKSLSQQTSDHVKEQKNELSSVSTSIETMNLTAGQVLKFAETTNSNVESADQLAKQGSVQMVENHNSIESVHAQFKDSLSSILELDKGVNQIETILQTIGSIAEQTNLLALNAAIEAARAGEQGRGFAVVADEVRSLANRTQQSTAEIQAMTIQMLSDSKRAVNMVTDSGSRIEKSLSMAKQANETISQFTTVMKDIRKLSDQITGQTQEQSSATQAVSKNIDHITHLATNTEKIALQTNQSGLKLSELSDDLIKKIGRFKL